MKKTAKKIAMVLVIVILANSFTSCFTLGLFEYGGGDYGIFGIICALPFTLALDLITSPIQITIYAVQKEQERKRNERAKLMEGIDTFSETQFNLIAQKINALPEDRIVPFTETINSFSEKEDFAMTEAINYLTEEEITSSVKILNSMTNEELITALNSFRQIEFRYKD
ncbi:MAG: hypothetical protein FWC01_07310 [Treponema sp.]|nr:hypothetical protein [Treponema sp.]MCL2237647.1 hypothetical protein [Treponema sp.]